MAKSSNHKQSKADFLREWGLPYPSFKYDHLRYKHPPEKGVYWYYFSLHVRQRDIEQYGTCISCGRPISMDNANAGHFMPAEDCGYDLLFDEHNVNAECQHCNAWDSTHLLGYAENLDKRYGAGTAQGLRDRRKAYKDSPKVIKDYPKAHYIDLIYKLPTFTVKV